jgi:NitT/TauT family transport system permease protein
MARAYNPHAKLSQHSRWGLGLASFLLPILLWCAVSYVPFIWHPLVQITDPGGVSYFETNMRTDRSTFADESANMKAQGQPLPQGIAANPVYLPAPHEVAKAFYTAFTTAPPQQGDPWLHESLWHSIKTVFYAFFISSLIGVPLAILCGTSPVISRLTEPFVEFFRYLPAPAFGALMVAILGIYDGPKIAIIVIGTLFQQVLIIANTTRKLEVGLMEAALTLGATRRRLLLQVVVPGILPDLYRDQRILLGWAWTYLIVAELIGTSSGITWFITQQARYQHFDNVYAAIIMIGMIGLGIDLALAWFGRRLFPWDKSR